MRFPAGHGTAGRGTREVRPRSDPETVAATYQDRRATKLRLLDIWDSPEKFQAFGRRGTRA